MERCFEILTAGQPGQLNQSLIFNENTYRTSFCAIGINHLSTGSDNLAMSRLVYFNNENIVLVDLDSTPLAYPEELLGNSHQEFTLAPYIINFEQEPGSDSAYAMNHWQSIFRDLVKKYEITVKNTQTRHSKYNRARSTTNMIIQNRLFFDAELILKN